MPPAPFISQETYKHISKMASTSFRSQGLEAIDGSAAASLARHFREIFLADARLREGVV